MKEPAKWPSTQRCVHTTSTHTEVPSSTRFPGQSSERRRSSPLWLLLHSLTFIYASKAASRSTVVGETTVDSLWPPLLYTCYCTSLVWWGKKGEKCIQTFWVAWMYISVAESKSLSNFYGTLLFLRVCCARVRSSTQIGSHARSLVNLAC